jgi:polysaccharide biosynthesis/export protein
MEPKFRATLAAVLLFLPLLASSQTTQPAAPPAAAPNAAAPQQPAPPSAESNSQYIIGPGDIIQVFVWRNPELTVTVPVRPDGKISSPLVEDMPAVGKRPSELARDIEKVLAEYIRSPQVNVIVSTAVSTFNQVKVIGQVVSPQSLAFRDGLKVLDAVLAVGGLGPYAAGNRSKIVRTGKDGKPHEIKVKLADLIDDGDMSQNLPLLPGDVLVVPQSYF